MLKKTVNYEDFDGNKRTEDLYFNLTKLEATEFALDLPDEITDEVVKEGASAANMEAATRIVQKLGGKGIIDYIRKLVLKSYGIKSEDGKRFIKSEEISTAFSQTEAYSNLFMELASDADAASTFVNGIVPQVEESKAMPVAPAAK